MCVYDLVLLCAESRLFNLSKFNTSDVNSVLAGWGRSPRPETSYDRSMELFSCKRRARISTWKKTDEILAEKALAQALQYLKWVERVLWF